MRRWCASRRGTAYSGLSKTLLLRKVKGGELKAFKDGGWKNYKKNPQQANRTKGSLLGVFHSYISFVGLTHHLKRQV